MSESIGRISRLCRYPEKGAKPVEEEALTLEAGIGIIGDCHADGSGRQIALLTMTEKNWMEKQGEKGFCFRKYKENLLLDGCSLKEWKAGDSLQMGTVVLRITDSKKSCHRELCALAKTQEACMLAGCCAFAVVETSGVIEKGMDIRKQE